MYPSAALCRLVAIQCNEVSISIALVSFIHELSSILSSILDIEFSVSAVIVLSSLDKSDEIVSLYESTVTSLFFIKLFSRIFGRLSSLWMCWVYSLSGSDLIKRGFSFFNFLP